MINPLGKALHKFTESLNLRLDFDIELSDEEVFADLSYGRDLQRTRLGSSHGTKELS